MGDDVGTARFMCTPAASSGAHALFLAIPASSRCISQQPVEKGAVAGQLLIAVMVFLFST